MGLSRAAVVVIAATALAACGGGHGSHGTTTTSSGASSTVGISPGPPGGVPNTAPIGTPATSSSTSTTHPTTTTTAGGTTTSLSSTTTTHPTTTTTAPTTTTTGGGTTQHCTASMSNPGPAPGGTDTVNIASNVASSPDTIVVHFSNGAQTFTSHTDPSGADHYTFSVGHPPPGQPVPVTVTIQHASCSTSFTPQ